MGGPADSRTAVAGAKMALSSIHLPVSLRFKSCSIIISKTRV